MYAALLSWVICAAAPESADTVVVCPQAFRHALQPWLAYRSAQGHRFAFAPNTASPAEIRDTIRQVAQAGALRFVLLVGDADPAAARNQRARSLSTPTCMAAAKVIVQWGSEPELATDNWYADLDDDQAPDVAIGRLTADTSEELATMVGKIMAYEAASGDRDWRRRINFVAGVGGFGPLVDLVLESAAKKFLSDGIPAAYETTMTYGSWRSPYCPDPRRFHEAAIGRFNEGCMFWIYMGHGWHTQLDCIRVPGGEFPILDTSQMHELRCEHGAPIAIFLSCYAGAFDQSRDCLAEEMLRAQGGPAAVLAASRVTMPYAMAAMGNAMMEEFFLRNRHQTIGEVVLHAKRRMMRPDTARAAGDDAGAFNGRLLEAVAAAVSPRPDQMEAERIEHVLLFNLLGDPLMRLRRPREVTLDVSSTVSAGERLEIAGSTEVAGRCMVELVCRRDRTKAPAPARREFVASEEALAAFSEAYLQANDLRWTARELHLARGAFHTELAVPLEAHGPCHVRVFLEGEGDYALGAADVLVRPYRVAEAASSR
jgi:hypothetical protein